ncbi:uncharacterized protein LOC131947444 [Physella acuta]|uniref:uncharacterized protein LOC131947444 n=1 Tax=Physella acuta TaxID=109671 RepID=UPI0027DC99C5|nr:uncharacterized protein LOC131947444 [Physella acuta]
MPSRIHVKFVTERKKYLEKQIQVLEPVLGNMKKVVAKSKAWLEEKTDQSSVSYIELSQELDTAATALLDVTSHILDEDNMDVNKPTPSLPQPDTQTTAKFLTVESPRQLKTQVQHTAVEEHPDLERRLAYIETTLSSLQDTQHKSTDDISEIKQWRDNFVTEQSDMGVNIEQLTKNQKQNFKNFRKQMNEQDNKVKELNIEIESLKEKESKSNKSLEKLSLDMKEYENNLLKINKEMQDHTDKTDSITVEIKRHSDLIVTVQEDNKNVVDKSTKLEKMQSKHNVMYKLLQQRLMPIDKLIQIFNQNLETREKRKKKLDNIENTISKLSKHFHLIESRVCNRYVCHAELADPTPVSTGLIISTFDEVREYNGQHFNQTTGKFESPHDGLYLVCVTLNEWEDKQIEVEVVAGGVWWKSIEVKCANTNAAGSVVVDLKKGQELYIEVSDADQDAELSSYKSRVCNRYACYMEFANPTPVSDGSIISTFGDVSEYNGQHFNQTTGKFISPHDGLYLVCVTLNESEDKQIEVGVMFEGEWCKFIEVKCADTSAAGSVVVDMKKGQEIYLEVYNADQGATLSCYSSFTICISKSKMRSRIQLRHVTEIMKFLEEQLHLIDPLILIMQNAVEKSKIWIEDKNDNPSITYSDLCQELDSATTAMLGAALHIISENKETLDVDTATPSFYQSTTKTQRSEKRDWTESTNQGTKQLEQTDEILSRLKQIETSILSLQDVSRLEQIETAISSLQDVSRLEQIETAIFSLQDVSRLEQIETTISSLQDVSRLEQIETAITSLQDVSRLEQIETALCSLQEK